MFFPSFPGCQIEGYFLLVSTGPGGDLQGLFSLCLCRSLIDTSLSITREPAKYKQRVSTIPKPPEHDHRQLSRRLQGGAKQAPLLSPLSLSLLQHVGDARSQSNSTCYTSPSGAGFSNVQPLQVTPKDLHHLQDKPHLQH